MGPRYGRDYVAILMYHGSQGLGNCHLCWVMDLWNDAIYRYSGPLALRYLHKPNCGALSPPPHPPGLSYSAEGGGGLTLLGPDPRESTNGTRESATFTRYNHKHHLLVRLDMSGGQTSKWREPLGRPPAQCVRPLGESR